MVRTLPSSMGGIGSNPSWGNKIPHAIGYGLKKKKNLNDL